MKNLNLLFSTLLAMLPLASPSLAQVGTWTISKDDTWSGRTVPTTSGAAGSTTGVAGDGKWTDVHGSVWNINTSSQLVGTPQGASPNDFLLTRPVAEETTNQKVTIYIPAGAPASLYSAVVRYQSTSGNWYDAQFNYAGSSSFIRVQKLVGGTRTTVGTGVNFTATGNAYSMTFSVTGSSPSTLNLSVTDQTTSTTTSITAAADSDSTLQSGGQVGVALFSSSVAGTFTRATTYYDSGQTLQSGPPLSSGTLSNGTIASSAYSLSWTAASGGTAPITYQVQRSTDNVTFANVGSSQSGTTYTDNTVSASTLYYYRVVATDSAGTPATVTSNVVSGTTPAAAVTATGYTLTGPSSGNANTQSTNFTVTVTPTNGQVPSTVTVTPASTVAGSFTPSTVTFPAGTPNASASFTFTPTATGTATISTTNSSTLTNPTSLSYVVNVGTITVTPKTTYLQPTAAVAGTGITMSAPTPTGGSGGYHYAYQRSTTAGFAWGTGTTVGSDATSFTDSTAATNVRYHYKVRITDGAGDTPYVSNDANAIVEGPAVQFIGMGDSLMAGQTLTTPSTQNPLYNMVNLYLPALKGFTIAPYVDSTNNQAHGGSAFSDWQPAGAYYTTAKAAWQGMTIAPTDLILMLGDNDSAATHGSQTASQYIGYADTTLKQFHTDFPTCRIWWNYSPFTPVWADSQQLLVQSYQAAITTEIASLNAAWGDTYIRLADTHAWDFFGNHLSDLNNSAADFVHFNTQGALDEGNNWANAWYKGMFGTATSTTLTYGRRPMQ